MDYHRITLPTRRIRQPLLAITAATLLMVAMACGGSDAPPAQTVALTPPPALNTVAVQLNRTAANTPPAAPAAVAAAPPAVEGFSDEQVIVALDRAMAGIYERTLPSVVGIQVIQNVGLGERLPPGVSPGNLFSRATGSGIVWDGDGHIVTNRHVITDANRIVIELSNGIEVDAELVGADPDSDLAVVRISDASVRPQPIALGDSNKVNVGQLAIAIGEPFSRGFSMTSGIISAVGRTINPMDSSFSVPRVIQHDAATNPGNSGGPLLDRNGQVIGINTQIISETGAFSGIGLAVPVNLVKQVAPALIADGYYEYPYIGIRGTTIGPDIARAMGLPPETRGGMVIAVGSDTAAERAGLLAADRVTVVDGLELPVGGDIIIAIDNTPIRSMNDVIAYIVENTRPGDTVEFTVLRQGAEMRLPITLDRRPR